MDNKGGGIGILLLIVVGAMALMGKKGEAEAAVGVLEIPIEPYVPLEPVAPGEVPTEGRVSTPADDAMARQRAKAYAAREAEALAKADAEAQAVIAGQRARGLSVSEMADEDALDALARADEAERTGDLSKLGYWGAGYVPGVSGAKIIEDVRKAAESQIVISKTQKKITEAVKAKGKTTVTDEEVAASKGTLIKDPKTGAVYARYGQYGFMQVA